MVEGRLGSERLGKESLGARRTPYSRLSGPRLAGGTPTDANTNVPGTADEVSSEEGVGDADNRARILAEGRVTMTSVLGGDGKLIEEGLTDGRFATLRPTATPELTSGRPLVVGVVPDGRSNDWRLNNEGLVEGALIIGKLDKVAPGNLTQGTSIEFALVDGLPTDNGLTEGLPPREFGVPGATFNEIRHTDAILIGANVGTGTPTHSILTETAALVSALALSLGACNTESTEALTLGGCPAGTVMGLELEMGMVQMGFAEMRGARRRERIKVRRMLMTSFLFFSSLPLFCSFRGILSVEEKGCL